MTLKARAARGAFRRPWPMAALLLLLAATNTLALPMPRMQGEHLIVPSYHSPNATLLKANRANRDPKVAAANVLFLMCDSMDGRVLGAKSP